MTDVPMSMKAPPNYREGDSYEEYKRDLEIWQLLKVATDIEEGPLVYRTLTGRAKAACNDLTVNQIGAKNGLALILERLDAVFLVDENQRIFVALDEFEKFKRPSSMTMTNFILSFENLHNKVTTHNCKYPDGVLAYRLIKAANMSSEHERLCRATVGTGKWSYKAVVDQLKKIFSEIPVSSPNIPAIKVENTLLTVDPSPHSADPFDYEDNGELYDNQQLIDQQYNEPIASPNNEDYDIYYSPSMNMNYSQGRFRNSQRGGGFGASRFYNNQRKPSFTPPQGYQRFPNPRFQTGSRPPTGGEYKSLKSSYNPDPTVPNPKDNKGNYTICRRCRSTYHWIADCPHIAPEERLNSSGTYYARNADEEIYIALLQSNIPRTKDEITGLVAETFCKGVIDSGCTKTVAGENWFNEYTESLSDEEIAAIQYTDSEALFRFGDSNPVRSVKRALLPMVLGGKHLHLATEIVPSDVPLLLSKETMKTAEADIDFKSDSITLFGKKQPLICTRSGHYAIPITSSSLNESSLEVNNVLLNITESDVHTTAKKLHKQFNHPSSKRMISLVKTAGIEDKELFEAIEAVYQRCDTCKRYKKARPTPITSFPLATEFNETVALDLKVHENTKTYFLHLIDHATKLSAAAVIKSKKSGVIINEIMMKWISIFGTPKTLLSDNGGEFANEEFVDMCQNLNINFITSAAEAPWSHGMIERHNAIIGEGVDKIMEEVDCSIEVALCWAISAKNSLQNVFGFSSYQLVFGRNPNLPSVLTDKLPALEGVTGSHLIAKHLNAMHKAREEYIKLEASERIRRGLRSKTRTHNDVVYLPGDEVFWKRDEENRWRGPGKVIGQDGSKVLIKTPCSYIPISVHTCRVILTSETEENRAQLEKSTKPEQQAVSYDEEESGFKRNEQNTIDVSEDHQETEDIDDTDTEADDGDQIVNPDENNKPVEKETPLIPINLEQNLQAVHNKSTIRNLNDFPRSNQCVKYRHQDSDDWTSVKVLGRAGKVGKNKSGKNKGWFNVRRLEDNIESSMNFSEVSEWSPIEHDILIATIKEDKFIEARETELKNWKDMAVYEEVDDENQTAISGRWVYKEKITNNGPLKKARFVARGYEEVDFNNQSDSPTCNKDSLRVVISIIASKEWTINSLDVKAAFLQGKQLDREVYLIPPPEAKVSGKLWKLKRAVYGLNDASRFWYLRVREELSKAGCKCSKADPSVYYYFPSNLEGVLISHVDDFVWSGTERFRMSVIERIKTIFKISEENTEAFKYVGIEIYQDDQGIHVDQKKYTEELQEIKIKSSNKESSDRLVNEDERKSLRSVIGQINWLATQTRPDLSYTVSELGSNFKNATIKHLMKANKLVKKAKFNAYSLFFPKLDLTNIKVRCYADASFGKLNDGGSQGGMFVELFSNNNTSPIAWQSKRISRVVSSTMAAETLALVKALDAAFLISSLVSELLTDGKEKISIEAITDSKSLYESSYSTKSLLDRRLRIDMSILREYIINDKCVISWVPSGDQLADFFTKEGVEDTMLISHITK